MYDHQFQAGVPYFLQWAGPIEAYEQLAIERKLPAFQDPFGLLHTGDDFGNSLEETLCGLPQSAAVAGEDQLSGRYSDWHRVRDHAAGATAAQIPMFLVHGVNDNAARVDAMQWFTNRGAAPATSCGSASGITASAAVRTAAPTSGRRRCTRGSTVTSPAAPSTPGPPSRSS
jgi:hypothetical protein